MGTTAHMPIRLRIDPALAGGEIEAQVREAVRTAGARGMAAFEREVLAARGGYARPAFRTPAFRWQGRPVEARWRQGLEAAIAEELQLLSTGVSRRIEQQLRTAPEVMPPDPSEWFDPARQGSGGYMVASYQGDLPAPDEPLAFDSVERADSLLPAGHYFDWWTVDANDPEKIERGIAAALIQHFGVNGTAPATLCMMFRSTLSGSTAFHFQVIDRVRIAGNVARWNYARWWRIPTEFEIYKMDSANGAEPERVAARPLGLWALDRIADFSDQASKLMAFRRYAFARMGVSEAAAAGETAEATTLRQSLTRFVEDRAAAEPFTGTLAELRDGSGHPFFIILPSGAMRESQLPLVPIASLHVLSENVGENEGGGGGAERTGDGAGEGVGGNLDALEGGEGDAGADAGAIPYPVIIGGSTLEIDLGPFEGEPHLDQLGEAGAAMRRLIARIAFRLGMPPGDYCGSFLLAAAQVMGARAAAIAIASEQHPEMTTARPAGNGNLGAMDLRPQITPAIQLMRHLGGTCPLISQLTRMMSDTYQTPGIMERFTGRRRGKWNGWMLDFLKEQTPAMTQSVAVIYQRTCQIMMLQLLRASHEEISNRIRRFDKYFPIAEAMINRLVRSEAELLVLRDTLLTVQSFTSPSAVLQQGVADWREARQLLSSDLSDIALNVAAVTSPGRLLESRGTLERYEGGWKVRDARGRRWTMDELEREIAMRHQMATSIDPLINQFDNIPAVAATFRDSPHLARAYLFALLVEMKTNNGEITERTKSDNLFAFQSGKIMESLPKKATVAGTSVVLQGIHLIAHQAIGSSFQGNHWYGSGLDWAFGVELGKQSLTVFAETVSVLALSVLCPPLGIALGAEIAAAHYHSASVREQLYESLMEQLMSRAEVEFDMFMAQFEVALSIIPDIGAIGRGVGSVSRAGARGKARCGVVAGGRAAMRRAQREILASFAEQARAGLARAFVTSVLVDRVMTLGLPRILGPVMEEVNREITVLTGGVARPREGGERVPTVSEAAGLPPPDYAGMSPAEAELVRRLEEYQEGDRDERPTPLSELP